ncbi:hypothetical protein E2C01_048952 [Portunus trituberculatus]|uniref:Uncharacterized protein n=1 Tax=Portunus trituberculatus TaxID=210409 RepID=A0A5B7G4Z7_PORTR|nr:hypothetical protein [Portunus trituberculatus]
MVHFVASPRKVRVFTSLLYHSIYSPCLPFPLPSTSLQLRSKPQSRSAVSHPALDKPSPYLLTDPSEKQNKRLKSEYAVTQPTVIL